MWDYLIYKKRHLHFFRLQGRQEVYIVITPQGTGHDSSLYSSVRHTIEPVKGQGAWKTIIDYLDSKNVKVFVNQEPSYRLKNLLTASL